MASKSAGVVGIVGGGMAGVAAARVLSRRGPELFIMENQMENKMENEMETVIYRVM